MSIAIVLTTLVVSISVVPAVLVVPITIAAALRKFRGPACRMLVAETVSLTQPERFCVSDDEGVSTTIVSRPRTDFNDSRE